MNTDHRSAHRLVIVSNRLPVVLKQDAGGRWQCEPGSGGLVTAMAPVLKRRGGLWIGWPGTPEQEGVDLESLLSEAVEDFGYHFKPVLLSAEEVDGYYHGFANEILWPLFHDLQTRCNFAPGYWEHYWSANRKFAEVVAGSLQEEDHIWVHDYQLIGVGIELRQMDITSRIGYFLHIPFPPLDLFLKLPWRHQVLNALLAYDLVGFQTQRDKANFLQCIRSMRKDLRVRGKGRVSSVEVEGREVRVGNFPISIDFEEFADRAQSAEVGRRAEEIRENIGLDADASPRAILLGVDRLDYTKGVPERLKAFGTVLERYPELRQKISLVQIVVPSRVHIPKYQDLKREIEGLVSRINGRYGRTDWVPIHYIFRSVDRGELLALYRAADIGLVTPLKDGMNLVAKEYCAANVSGDGVLVLSEFAGAAAQLHPEAILVNPYDVEGVADAIASAYKMAPAERRRRMGVLRRKIRKFDIYWWVDTFMNSIFAHGLQDFPLQRDEIPVGGESGLYMQTASLDPRWMQPAAVQ